MTKASRSKFRRNGAVLARLFLFGALWRCALCAQAQAPVPRFFEETGFWHNPAAVAAAGENRAGLTARNAHANLNDNPRTLLGWWEQPYEPWRGRIGASALWHDFGPYRDMQLGAYYARELPRYDPPPGEETPFAWLEELRLTAGGGFTLAGRAAGMGDLAETEDAPENTKDYDAFALAATLSAGVRGEWRQFDAGLALMQSIALRERPGFGVPPIRYDQFIVSAGYTYSFFKFNRYRLMRARGSMIYRVTSGGDLRNPNSLDLRLLVTAYRELLTAGLGTQWRKDPFTQKLRVLPVYYLGTRPVRRWQFLVAAAWQHPRAAGRGLSLDFTAVWRFDPFFRPAARFR